MQAIGTVLNSTARKFGAHQAEHRAESTAQRAQQSTAGCKVQRRRALYWFVPCS